MKDLKSFLRLQSEGHWRSSAMLEFIPRGSWSRKSVPPTRTKGITGTDSWAPEAYCRRRAAGPVRRTSQVAAVSLPSLPVSPLPPLPPQRSIRPQCGPGACSPPLSRAWSPSPSYFLNGHTWSKLDSRRGLTGWLDTVLSIFLFCFYRTLVPLSFTLFIFIFMF